MHCRPVRIGLLYLNFGSGAQGGSKLVQTEMIQAELLFSPPESKSTPSVFGMHMNYFYVWHMNYLCVLGPHNLRRVNFRKNKDQ